MVDEALARSFEGIGADYDRYRPGFPAVAADAIVPRHVGVALDLGAGTGKFTEHLVDRADRVMAVEPSAAMLEVLREKLPTVQALAGDAEQIPVGDAAVDVVAVAQAFHWFDRVRACAEIARVLRPGGTLGLLWNRSDPACSWDTAAARVIHPAVGEADETTSTAEDLPGFRFDRLESFHWSEPITRDDYLARWSTVSTYLVAEPSAKAAMTAAIEEILDADAATRGLDGLELPHLTDVYLYTRV
ncbi:class I SAM-dependent methyltransferase [Microbacterium hydrocarbonoxydans]|uniref:class I SAM-dependent methyltransferase n=1 Tax=Microbacterium hydrocarbonoxydans TaxID=273678 RepID=UPI00203C6613|nr:class I SAM-dependent methyltransferase [Microbacterium hydrocarbonoxydans]MCM3779007.1 class I SAM-dependent methyltransferase [Microbacterium hydrocarbonoxydans]